ncbi:MAG: ribulose-phosphate 3-epimerase [Lachnospiraceae bacterium]|nr:ribulose-phosphate 3-epimerase [Lachnospiraceae bacterium]
MLILSPSILAADFADLKGCLSKTERADYIHFDVMDGMFVPNISFGIPILESVRRITENTLDVHLMIEEPARYIDKFHDAGADILTVHYEACSDVRKTLDTIHEKGMKAGLAIKPDTDISVLKPYFGLADMFLVMTVEPGFGGQSIIQKCIDKVSDLRKLLNESGYDTDIEVDGGITRENIDILLSAGANVIVMGSSVFKGDIAANVDFFLNKFEEVCGC